MTTNKIKGRYKVKDITLAESRTVARTPRSQVIDFIHQELTDILPYLPTRDALADAQAARNAGPDHPYPQHR